MFQHQNQENQLLDYKICSLCEVLVYIPTQVPETGHKHLRMEPRAKLEQSTLC